MLKSIMLEEEMENLLEKEKNYKIRVNGITDSTKVVDVANELGYESYMLEGNGKLDQTLIFIKKNQ